MVTFHRNDLGTGTYISHQDQHPSTNRRRHVAASTPGGVRQAPSAGRGVRNAEEVKKPRVSWPEIKAVALELEVSTQHKDYITFVVFFFQSKR